MAAAQIQALHFDTPRNEVGVAVDESGYDKLSPEVDDLSGLGPMVVAWYLGLYYTIGYV